MVISTSGIVINLDELIKSGVIWKRDNFVLEYASVDNGVVHRLFEKHS